MEVAAAVEATAGAWVDQAAFVVTRRWRARSLEEFGAMGWLLAVLAGERSEERQARLLRQSGMRNGGLKGLGRSWDV